MVDRSPVVLEPSRRAVLASVGATIGGVAFTKHTSVADAQPSPTDQSSIVLRQGSQCYPVTPFTGEQSVEKYFEYRIPDRYATDENGGTDPGSGPYYSSQGTAHLQQDGTSLLFLYDGPNGLSLVIVHGSNNTGPTGGGSATFEIADLPDDGSWVVKDDYYIDPNTGDIVQSNYDNWDIDGEPHVIDWTWDDGRTDGGAFRGLTGALPITIAPGFNEDAALFGTHNDGTVQSWQLLVPDGDGVMRTPLDLDEHVTIETGTCGSNAPPSQPDARVQEVEFKGCGQVWFVFEESFTGAIEVAVRTTAGWQSVELKDDELERVPGQFGESPLVKHRVHGPEKILAVETQAGITDNHHNCARSSEDNGDPGRDDRDTGDENKDDEDDGDDDDPNEEADERTELDDDDEEDEEDDGKGERGEKDEKDDGKGGKGEKDEKDDDNGGKGEKDEKDDDNGGKGEKDEKDDDNGGKGEKGEKDDDKEDEEDEEEDDEEGDDEEGG